MKKKRFVEEESGGRKLKRKEETDGLREEKKGEGSERARGTLVKKKR